MLSCRIPHRGSMDWIWCSVYVTGRYAACVHPQLTGRKTTSYERKCRLSASTGRRSHPHQVDGVGTAALFICGTKSNWTVGASAVPCVGVCNFIIVRRNKQIKSSRLDCERDLRNLLPLTLNIKCKKSRHCQRIEASLLQNKPIGQIRRSRIVYLVHS